MSPDSSRTPRIDALQLSNWSRDTFEAWQEGGMTCVHVTTAIWEDARTTLNTIGDWNQRFREFADLIMPVRNGQDLEDTLLSKRTGVILGFQNSSPFDHNIDMVEIFHQLGVRIAQLTYNTQSLVGGSCYEAADGGLTKFGELVTEEMNRVGMLADLSHVGTRTSLDVIEHSSRSVAITHANPLFFYDHPRNKSDEVLKKLAARGGIVGLAPYVHLIPDGCTLSDWCEMVARTVELIGIDHVGLGTDTTIGFDDSYMDWIRMGHWTRSEGLGAAKGRGFDPPPDWYEDSRNMPQILDGLAAVGLSESEVGAVAGQNWQRFLASSFVANINEDFRPRTSASESARSI